MDDPAGQEVQTQAQEESHWHRVVRTGLEPALLRDRGRGEGRTTCLRGCDLEKRGKRASAFRRIQQRSTEAGFSSGNIRIQQGNTRE